VTRKEELVQEIAKAEVLLSRLEAEQAQARTRLAALQAELAALEAAEPAVLVPVPATPPRPIPANAAEKVRLFRTLFRGRTDVFPTRFVSKRTGKAGYAPACTNKFVQGVCELPRVKCAETFEDFFRQGDVCACQPPTKIGRFQSILGPVLAGPSRTLQPVEEVPSGPRRPLSPLPPRSQGR
jgi:hypothetical protein